MNIQEFNNLKVGDMVKVQCPYCTATHYYIGKVTDKISIWTGFPLIVSPGIKTDAVGLNGVEIDIINVVRKLPKPEKRAAYWCKTMDDAKNFLEDCEAWGIKWCMGEDATKFSNWILGKNGVYFYLHERGGFVNGDNCISWSGRTHDKLDEYDYMKYDIDRYIEYPGGKVLWDRAEEEAKKKAATLYDEINKLSQEAWARFAKMYADTDSIKCCCKNKCGSRVNYKPTVKEVERPAKVGEYIKIVAEWHNSLSRGKYTKGDIGLVTMLNGDAIKATINGYDNVPVGRLEYVVLENYKPAVREVNRPAKAGEYIKIFKPLYTFNQVGDILKVDYTYRNGGVNVKVEDHPRDASKPTGWTDPDTWYYGPGRYVVLENYRP